MEPIKAGKKEIMRKMYRFDQKNSNLMCHPFLWSYSNAGAGAFKKLMALYRVFNMDEEVGMSSQEMSGDSKNRKLLSNGGMGFPFTVVGFSDAPVMPWAL